MDNDNKLFEHPFVTRAKLLLNHKTNSPTQTTRDSFQPSQGSLIRNSFLHKYPLGQKYASL